MLVFCHQFFHDRAEKAVGTVFDNVVCLASGNFDVHDLCDIDAAFSHQKTSAFQQEFCLQTRTESIKDRRHLFLQGIQIQGLLGVGIVDNA